MQNNSIIQPAHAYAVHLNQGEVLVRLRFAGNSGINPHGDNLEVGNEPYLGQLSISPNNAPQVIGHGISGAVLGSGPGCSLEINAPVTVQPITPCRRCGYCRDQRYTACISKELRTPRRSGDHVVLPRSLVTVLPNDFTLAKGALIQPLALAKKAMEMTNMEPGKCLVIFGASFIGIQLCLLARRTGIMNMLVVDTDEENLMTARQIVQFSGVNQGAPSVPVRTYALKAGGNSEVSTRDLVQAIGDGPDVCVNVTGDEEFENVALKALKPGGMYIPVDVGKESEVDWSVRSLFRDDVTISEDVGSEGANFEEALKLVTEGVVDLERFCVQE